MLLSVLFSPPHLPPSLQHASKRLNTRRSVRKKEKIRAEEEDDYDNIKSSTAFDSTSLVTGLAHYNHSSASWRIMRQGEKKMKKPSQSITSARLKSNSANYRNSLSPSLSLSLSVSREWDGRTKHSRNKMTLLNLSFHPSFSLFLYIHDSNQFMITHPVATHSRRPWSRWWQARTLPLAKAANRPAHSLHSILCSTLLQPPVAKAGGSPLLRAL